MIRVLYYAGVRERVGASETCVEGFSGTLTELLEHLEERHGISVFDPSKPEGTDPFSALIIMINGRHFSHVGGHDAPIADGDTVAIFPVIGGG